MICSVLVLAFTSCTKEDNERVTTGTSTLLGTNNVPAVTTTATAKASYSYNALRRVFTYQVEYTGLTDSCTQIGIARASAGQAVPASAFQLFNFNTPASLQRRTAATYAGFFIVDGYQMVLDDLLTGKYCIYLRSKAFNTGGGEIRAQISF